MKMINLGKLQIPVSDFAIQGNALFGIKESGKTATSIYLAEQLLDNGIPIVTFDPIGIHKNIRIPAKPGNLSYKVVVAGGKDGDLEITPETAPMIVRAAMQNNIPLIVDLYDPRLSKKARRRIVQESIEVLLYENSEYGNRHVIIEEAPQYVPQRVMGENAQVYGALEEFCRLGGNSLLGYTLIGQRPEEINKAVLEMCDCLFMFRQKGRNTLTSIRKWMNLVSPDMAGEVGRTMTTLQAGECWVWARETLNPILTKIPMKQTFHPDRRNNVNPKSVAKDVGSFVNQMNKSLEKQRQFDANKKPLTAKALKVSVSGNTKNDAVFSQTVSNLQDEINRLVGELSHASEALATSRDLNSRLSRKNDELMARIEKLKGALLPQYQSMKNIFDEIPESDDGLVSQDMFDLAPYQKWLDKVKPKQKEMILCLLQNNGRMTRKQLGLMTGVVAYAKGGQFNALVKELENLQLVLLEGDDIILSKIN